MKKRRFSDAASTSSSEPDVAGSYQYKALKDGEIRILTVHPSRDFPLESTLVCTLRILKKDASRTRASRRSNKEDEPYEALSYVWGGQEKNKEIQIQGTRSNKILKITDNLLSALQHLRYSDRPRRFWVDAVCINQGNLDEVNLQVPMMSKIYSEADNVCIWLGPGDDDSALAMSLLPRIRNLTSDFEKNVESSTSCREWAALIRLMGRAWFTRRWVVQEIALARRGTVHCGHQSTTWTRFSEAVALFQDCAGIVNSKFRQDKEYKNDVDYTGNVAEYPASRLVEATLRLIRKSQDNVVRQKICGLEYLVSVLTPFQAREPADSVYAVLALAGDVPGFSAVVTPTATIEPTINDAEDEVARDSAKNPMARKFLTALKAISKRYPVDYGKPFAVVCTDFLEFVFRTSQKLNMICRPWAPKTEAKTLPSWIVTLREATHIQRVDNKTMVRKRADILVKDPNESVYSASGKYPIEWKIVQGDDVEGSPILLAKGFILDRISKKDDAASAGVVPETWFDLGGWDPETDSEEPPPEEFWRTLVADRDDTGRNPPAWYPLACRNTLLYFNNSTGPNAVNLPLVGSHMEDPALLKRYIKRSQSVIWGRRLGRTHKHNLLALLPPKALENDLICIIFGVDVPVVLRPRTDDGYVLIGESYVHGMMDGEAFQIKNQSKQENETFALH
ncbi:HET-domain-containing protein [Lophiostoma macrostomum CBS 122681]|uniref:HET-domain-containing protein n=1 Tax=Lophiostoma macrostomum CBS 122681 TaxID=1314788 RepID=A0A6A6SXA3_9PLEO|nr:HET-domain-containing protein [Lophiostoma macrostomum CBS 122681]